MHLTPDGPAGWRDYTPLNNALNLPRLLRFFISVGLTRVICYF